MKQSGVTELFCNLTNCPSTLSFHPCPGSLISTQLPVISLPACLPLLWHGQTLQVWTPETKLAGGRRKIRHFISKHCDSEIEVELFYFSVLPFMNSEFCSNRIPTCIARPMSLYWNHPLPYNPRYTDVSLSACFSLCPFLSFCRTETLIDSVLWLSQIDWFIIIILILGHFIIMIIN